MLGRPLARAERAAVAKALRGLLAWQIDLRVFPRLRKLPRASPYVSLYANGTLRGCFGSSEGLARAFVRSMTDSRYGGIAPEERAALAADVAYVVRARPVRADEAPKLLDAGVHGAAVVIDGVATVLLPSVGRERGYDAAGFLDLLAKKTNRPRSDEGLVWLLDMDEVSSRGVLERDPMRGARRFLESLVQRDGRVAFEMRPASGELVHVGAMLHGRIAVAVEALAKLASKKTKSARTWLARAIDRHLGSPSATEGWPDRPDMVLGTLALAARAGLDVPLADAAARVDVAAASPWHLAQAASVLGARTPDVVWSAVVRSLDARPFSPYALMAAHARGDAEITRRCVSAMTASMPRETALASVAIEALLPLRSSDAKR
ncbi:MAG TPA: AMMECR1 domain-containing protein, partial [Polyangiaceae bacterium]|nr:AMMECR1 domain-containing protein [Polyangiaceae bacterium]